MTEKTDWKLTKTEIVGAVESKTGRYIMDMTEIWIALDAAYPKLLKWLKEPCTEHPQRTLSESGHPKEHFVPQRKDCPLCLEQLDKEAGE